MDEADDERDALEALADSPPPHRKTHYYSQRLRVGSGGGTHKRHHQLRNHSLDDDRIPKQYSNSSPSEDFLPHASSSSDFPCCRLDQSLPAPAADADGLDCPASQPLPEVVAGGGDSGVFRPPIRAAVHPNRPPCLELRPHPLRETQVGRFLRTMACTEAQLWAGQECGVRVWNFADAFESRLYCRKVRRGDEDAAPFYESPKTSPTICLTIDLGNWLVFTGHKDGKIRTWKMDHPTTDGTPFKEALSWQAHKGPVLAIVITSYGVHFTFSSLEITSTSTIPSSV